MSELVANCPRCGSVKMTFDVTQAHLTTIEYGWSHIYEAFCICRHCQRSSVFILEQHEIKANKAIDEGGLLRLTGSLNRYMRVRRYISLRDVAALDQPEHLPKEIEKAFKEGATCLATQCPNAAGTMFRLCLDLATTPLLPETDVEGLNAKIRRSLGLRLQWLLDHGRLPEALRELSAAVKDDGNDGAHAGSLSETDAADLGDFTIALLERMFTEPARLKLAKDRREQRRATGQQ